MQLWVLENSSLLRYSLLSSTQVTRLFLDIAKSREYNHVTFSYFWSLYGGGDGGGERGSGERERERHTH